ncbi:hypothetical protein [Saccharibacillus kuerlensis]|uniref:Uncharacterized protein n=1 Tax=Saccharibacillus kuerlensis TaxID=459527 RepID=A0ABQ2KZU4_9BACL|nr:hypothetical protein [Saccharibacillus kuerlensis]GGN95596.1 hypothetical protein GCM10010969_11630 [Saccharibacillus kuerlensis]
MQIKFKLPDQRILLFLLAVLLVAAVAFSAAVLFRQPTPDSAAEEAINSSENFRLVVDGGIYMPNENRSLVSTYRPEDTIRDALERSGIVKFDNEGRIASVDDAEVHSELKWAVKQNGKTLPESGFSTRVQPGDEILLYIEAPGNDGEPVNTLLISGGELNSTLSGSYAHPFTEGTTVLNVLKASGLVTMSENDRTIRLVKASPDLPKGYMTKPRERWVVKVNGKELKQQGGLDMLLQPGDYVELTLERFRNE